jgi:hypothetical protein
MIKFRSLIPHGMVLCALSLAIPAGALASPLLSGYGGPGEGSQVILGSALVNGPRGGGGGSSSGGAPTAPANVTPAVVAGGGTVHSHSSPTRSSSTKGTGGTKGTPARNSASHRSRAASGTAVPVAPVSVQGRTVSHSAALGLSSGELALIIVAACALVAIGFMTGRLARVPRHEGPVA